MTTPILQQDPSRAGSDPQASWLELARQQSQALAEGEARRPRSFRWQALEGDPQPRAAIFRWLVLRPSWAVVILLLVLAGGVTVGAYVSRRSPPPAKKPTSTSRQAPAAAPAAVPAKTKAPTTVEPAEVVEAREEAARPATVKAPEEKPAPEEKIILGPDDTDGAGEMIIVPAPRTKKLEPLFSPEDYKKKGRRGTRF